MLTRAMTISVVLALLGAPYAANAQAIPGAQAESSRRWREANGRLTPGPMRRPAIRL